MKKKLFFLPALAALFFSSCSSDEPSEPNNGPEENGRFLAVNIMSTGGSDSRAFADGGFDDGDEDESQATSALFAFYDENGNLSQTPQLVNLTEDRWTDAGDENPQSSKLATIVAIAGQKEPSSMLVVLNPTQRIRSDINGKNLETAKELVRDYVTTKPFIMTNSSYYNNGVVMETVIPANSIKDSRDAAREAAIDVYVERIVAKVNVTKGADWTVNSSEITVGTTTDAKITVYPDVQGVEIANIAWDGRLFKDITGINNWMNAWSGVNSINNRRSYWALTDVSKFNNRSWNEIEDQIEANPSYYILPNTSTDKYTSVLVKAVLKDADGKAVDLVQWAGNYYLKENFKNQIALFLNNEGYEVIVSEANGKATEHREFAAADVDYIPVKKHQDLTSGDDAKLKAYQSIGCVKADIKVGKNFQEDGSYTIVNDTELEAYLSNAHHVFDLWEGGKAYYFTRIEHNPDVEFFKYGVIRNHVYNLELTSLAGLGVPVVDPDKVIIPENPDDKLFYVGARVRILKWRVVPTQKVEFGK